MRSLPVVFGFPNEASRSTLQRNSTNVIPPPIILWLGIVKLIGFHTKKHRPGSD